ncbi:universal stress protein [Acinetobacter gerneri]|jgi:nucleotide-binding universal stress UspA family protein|uniref:Universal stress protein n=1 Tax=Acinetobacter gerneri TaxID=202952 RepID=A0AAW8JGG0_9GAMM|nr:universal stress protein [Acinetobacter gerneri]MCH4242660.1 universal stress protein [Acinetobacter gerneri]MDQ9009560.1 universal stress protein [Acinetobacter gerneri]MDQ9013844.1 universal stress protein [Acinetobacter gerneri]MDQ9025012.1 universal stress protein [Acinetobacter gerneri]MDQ9052228.1 universal stress protein [Acinetobacter gerneri]
MPYQHILVPIDDSPIAYAAMEHAQDIAQAFDAQITLVSVVAIDPFVGVDFYKVAPSITDHIFEAEKNAEGRLQDLKQTLEQRGFVVNTRIIREVPPAIGIVTIADEVNADLIIMGSHGRSGIKKFILGSVAQEVLTQSRLPVLIVK